MCTVLQKKLPVGTRLCSLTSSPATAQKTKRWISSHHNYSSRTTPLSFRRPYFLLLFFNPLGTQKGWLPTTTVGIIKILILLFLACGPPPMQRCERSLLCVAKIDGIPFGIAFSVTHWSPSHQWSWIITVRLSPHLWRSALLSHLAFLILPPYSIYCLMESFYDDYSSGHNVQGWYEGTSSCHSRNPFNGSTGGCD